MKQAEKDFLDEGQLLIDKLEPGLYLISEIYGKRWKEAPGGNRFGTPFKAAVNGGYLNNIVWVERRSDNNQLYEITPKI